MFKRRAKTTVADACSSESWQVSEGRYQDHPLYARFNTALKDAADKEQYPIQIGVAIPLRAPDGRGLPTEPELTELGVIEDQVVAAAGGRAVLVGVISTRSMREFVLYSATADWIRAFDEGLQAAVVGHKVQVMAQRDPSWDVYAKFL